MESSITPNSAAVLMTPVKKKEQPNMSLLSGVWEE